MIDILINGNIIVVINFLGEKVCMEVKWYNDDSVVNMFSKKIIMERSFG